MDTAVHDIESVQMLEAAHGLAELLGTFKQFFSEGHVQGVTYQV